MFLNVKAVCGKKLMLKVVSVKAVLTSQNKGAIQMSANTMESSVRRNGVTFFADIILTPLNYSGSYDPD